MVCCCSICFDSSSCLWAILSLHRTRGELPPFSRMQWTTFDLGLNLKCTTYTLQYGGNTSAVLDVKFSKPLKTISSSASHFKI